MAQSAGDDLIAFLEMAHSNQKANVATFAKPYSLISRINDCFSVAGKHLINPQSMMAGILFLRCQYAYKTAAGLTLSGQIVETFVMMRSCLEYAGYALLVFDDPDLEEIFLNRHVGADQMKVQKEKFKIINVKAAISRYDSKLGENFQIFYERSVDFGGHPNPHATNSALIMERSDDAVTITPLALSTNSQAILHAMKSVAQVGLTALFIFQHIFSEKFKILGIQSEMAALRTESL